MELIKVGPEVYGRFHIIPPIKGWYSLILWHDILSSYRVEEISDAYITNN